ncbi:metallophosphoesterase [Leptolyngbya cf. ectocarpi LEGE 11479]|uniref:Metallophosphoesterase n=1 Tax=Leptolyngbya cf. ectocarpi LEGE 11479 TaxID=1828722 RepID=A0A928ZV34_LEPEC|nr:metallophosphoesterase [Leptolyngbya ectocarpi]MBE9067994.1 metallophosphoesterase [Leptolyngbya cf. ectocarpi LEGE 11479]
MRPLLFGRLTVETVTIPMRDLPQRLQGTVIVQLSDFHYDGKRLSERILRDAIATIPALNPDLVVFTGDFITEEPDPIHPLTAQLSPIAEAYPTYAILGNHDNYWPTARSIVTAALTDIDITVLWNQVAYPFGKDLALVGLADYYHPDFTPEVLSQLPTQLPRIVLSHNPDTAEHMSPWRVDLQLSGHTHGGQIVLPGIGNLAARWFRFRKHLPKLVRKSKIPYVSERCAEVVDHWEWAMGLHPIGPNLLYVNRGLGSYAPGRLFCNPEITAITLTTAE